MADEEFDPVTGQTVEQRIDALASQPLITTGKPPSPEAVAEAKRIAGLKDLSNEELQALGKEVGVHIGFPAPDADPDEDPPEPEGHALSKEVSDWINHGQEFFHGPLPHDLAAIWAHPPMRIQDEATARILIAAWGVEGFRASALHQAALSDRARMVNSEEVTARFKAEREKKKEKR